MPLPARGLGPCSIELPPLQVVLINPERDLAGVAEAKIDTVIALKLQQEMLGSPYGARILRTGGIAEKLSGFMLLFEALILAMCRQMPFAAVTRLAGESWHRVQAICQRYVDLALANTDLSNLTRLAIDETSSRRGHNYLTFAADAEAHKVVFVTEGRDARTIAELGQSLREHLLFAVA